MAEDIQTSADVNVFQDTSTQAMTEVALGLSMAFFALLVIALISVTLPADEKSQSVNDTSMADQQEISLAQAQDKVDKKDAAPADKSDNSTANEQQAVIILFWEGQYFDIQHKLLSIQQVKSIQRNAQDNFVIAVNPDISFSELLLIQERFAGVEMRLTQLNDEWMLRLGEGFEQ